MSPLRPAAFELAELVCKMRADWDRAETDGAIRAAGLAEWTWPQTVQTTVWLACTPDQYPRDLVEATRKPFQHRPVLARERTAEHAEQARRLLTEGRQGTTDGSHAA
jgi:hypothetical protein